MAVAVIGMDRRRRQAKVSALGSRLVELRRRANLTQPDLADRLTELAWTRERQRVSLTEATISRWERGVQVPSPLYRRLLCEVYGVSGDELMGRHGVDGDEFRLAREVVRWLRLMPADLVAEIRQASAEGGL